MPIFHPGLIPSIPDGGWNRGWFSFKCLSALDTARYRACFFSLEEGDGGRMLDGGWMPEQQDPNGCVLVFWTRDDGRHFHLPRWQMTYCYVCLRFFLIDEAAAVMEVGKRPVLQDTTCPQLSSRCILLCSFKFRWWTLQRPTPQKIEVLCGVTSMLSSAGSVIFACFMAHTWHG